MMRGVISRILDLPPGYATASLLVLTRSVCVQAAFLSQTNDRDHAIGDLEVAPVSGRERSDLLPCAVALRALERLGPDLDSALAGRDPDLVRVLRQVQEPAGMTRRSSVGGHHDPAGRYRGRDLRKRTHDGLAS